MHYPLCYRPHTPTREDERFFLASLFIFPLRSPLCSPVKLVSSFSLRRAGVRTDMETDECRGVRFFLSFFISILLQGGVFAFAAWRGGSKSSEVDGEFEGVCLL